MEFGLGGLALSKAPKTQADLTLEQQNIVDKISESTTFYKSTPNDLAIHYEDFSKCLKEISSGGYDSESNIVKNLDTLVTQSTISQEIDTMKEIRSEFIYSLKGDLLTDPVFIRASKVIKQVQEQVLPPEEKVSAIVGFYKEFSYMQSQGLPYDTMFEKSFEFSQITHKLSHLLDKLQITEIAMLGEFVNKLPDVSIALLTPSLLFVLGNKAIHQFFITCYDENGTFVNDN